MGKRELLLIGIFLIVGVVVYQATAPPPDPNERGFSFSRVLDHVRREVAGNRASFELTSTSAISIDDQVSELRVVGPLISELLITGEERADVAVSLRVNSRAYNDEEARQYAKETLLKPDRAGTSLILRMDYPRPGRQRAMLTVRVPARLRVRIESRPERLNVTGVAAVESTAGAGETRLRDITGRVTLTQRGGEAVVERVGALKISSRGSELTVANVAGDAALVMEGGGELTAADLAGAVDVESRNAEIVLSKLTSAKGPVRVNVNGGSARLDGVSADSRIDGRNSELEITVGTAAPIAVYGDGGSVRLTLPASGYNLDAVVVEGSFGPETLVQELGLQKTDVPDSRETRISGPVNGGGPTITVRTTRAELTLGVGK
jgi:hypothetical protein